MKEIFFGVVFAVCFCLVAYGAIYAQGFNQGESTTAESCVSLMKRQGCYIPEHTGGVYNFSWIMEEMKRVNETGEMERENS